MTIKIKTFSLEPMYGESKMRIVSIDFDVVRGKDIYNPRNPVLETLPSKEIDYGRLFTYAFRRFGLPNIGSDSYKDIAEWILKTSHPELFLVLRPQPLAEAHFSIRFMVSESIASAARKWLRADIDAWIERKLDWAEQQGLPEWMPDTVRQYKEQFDPGATSWRDCYRGCLIMFEPAVHRKSSENEDEEDEKAFVEFAARVSQYRNIEPCPQYRERNPELSQWADDDPLKPLAEAAIEALGDLKTGVRVRDMAINAFGKMADDEGRVVDEPDGAGMTVGPMFNRAPQQSVELQALAHKLGHGNFKTGLKAILKLAGYVPESPGEDEES